VIVKYWEAKAKVKVKVKVIKKTIMPEVMTMK